MADEKDQRAMRNEQRMFVLLIGIVMAMGGWWLQNTYETILRNQQQLNSFMLSVNTRFVSNNQINIIQAENSRRFAELQQDIRRMLDAMEKRHPPGRTPITNGHKKIPNFVDP